MTTPKHLVHKRPKRKNVNREDTINQVNKALEVAVENSKSLMSLREDGVSPR